jgi:general stress protein 26
LIAFRVVCGESSNVTSTEPTIELDQRFSSDGAKPVSWTEVVDVIESAEMFWLSTVRGDGRPHVTPLPAMWLEGALHFCTGPDEQKTKNIEANPRCALTTGTNEFGAGLDVVVEGRAVRVTDEEMLARLAEMWLSKLDWRFDVVDGGFRDPAAPGDDVETGELATALVFGVAPSKVLAFGKGEPYSQTRYRF